MRLLFAGIILGCASVTQLQAALAITSLGTTTTIDFTGFTGAGFAPTPTAAQLDSDDWRVTGLSDGSGTFGGTYTSGDFARGANAGGVTTGGVYGFDVGSGNPALGIQPGGSDFTPGTFTLQLLNSTGVTVSDLDLSYAIYVLNDQQRGNSFNFGYSFDDGTYTPVAALDYTSAAAADVSPAWVANNRSTTLTGLNWADNSSLYLQWTGDDSSGSGSRDEFALDDIMFTAVPEPTHVALGVFGCLLGVISVGRRITRQRETP